MKPHATSWYGWKRDRPDRRDFKYTLGITGAKVEALPAAVDLRTTGFLPPVFTQGELGSCTANALAAMFYFVDRRLTPVAFLPSRLFIYYNERVVENTVASDAGAELRDGIKVIVDQGACVEALWPYDIDKFADQPPAVCYLDAQAHKATVYRSLTTVTDMKGCLAEGYPFVGGISVYSSFESDEVGRTGIVPLPAPDESMLGGHATLYVGYDNASNCFIGMNSWGDDWGQQGFFTIPCDYLGNPAMAADFWMVHTVTDFQPGV